MFSRIFICLFSDIVRSNFMPIYILVTGFLCCWLGMYLRGVQKRIAFVFKVSVITVVFTQDSDPNLVSRSNAKLTQ